MYARVYEHFVTHPLYVLAIIWFGALLRTSETSTQLLARTALALIISWAMQELVRSQKQKVVRQYLNLFLISIALSSALLYEASQTDGRPWYTAVTLGVAVLYIVVLFAIPDPRKERSNAWR